MLQLAAFFPFQGAERRAEFTWGPGHQLANLLGGMDEVQSSDAVDHREGNYAPIRDTEDPHLGLFDKPLPCCGCGIGWCSFLLGFVFPVTWYFAAILYFVKYYHRDPRERSGLAACAIAACICTLAAVITLLAILL